jgi:hypothetical protein
MNDAELLGLLERRSDPVMVSEVLAGMVGRAGLMDDVMRTRRSELDEWTAIWPPADRGYLYAGWPSDQGALGQLSPMLTRLVLANEPGRRVQVKANDPMYLGAKVWLAESRRPVGRVTAYDFSLRAGRQSDIIDARLESVVENPVGADAEFDMRVTDLPGDFELAPSALAEDAAGAGLSGRLKPIQIGALSAKRMVTPMAGHVESLISGGGVSRLEMRERHGGASVRVPIRVPIYRIRAVEDPPKLDGHDDDWGNDNQLRVFGDMKVGIRYVSRVDLLSGTVREDSSPASVRWSYDDKYVYMFASCPQETVTDDRNTTWPETDGRWWGEDGLQVELAEVGKVEKGLLMKQKAEDEQRVVRLGFKPSGVMMVKTGRIAGGQLIWTDGGPMDIGGGVKYGIVAERKEGRVTGYAVEAAIPRAWVSGTIEGIKGPAWRVNVLRHRASDLASMSWSGPVVNDTDVGLMGLLIGD